MTAVEAPVESFEILSDKTVRSIDYILRGLELGKFDETAKKVEFLGKLSGDEAPRYIATLLARIAELETLNSEAANDISSLQSRMATAESQTMGLTTDLQAIASGLRQLFEPKPLSNSWDMQEINNFCSKHGAS